MKEVLDVPTPDLQSQRYVTRNAALAEKKVPFLHRLYLSDGRVVEGKLYRGINSRLVDELYGQKGSFISIVDAWCLTKGGSIPYMAINERHIVSIEEISHRSSPDSVESIPG